MSSITHLPEMLGSRAAVPPARAVSASERSTQWAQVALLAILFAVPPVIALHMAAVGDPDIWWHLRTGEWIVQHHQVPHRDLFSAFGTGKPWEAYSWLFDLFAFQLFQHLGLRGILACTVLLVLAFTCVVFQAIRRLQADFSLAVLLTFAACFSCGRLFTPRPWLFSMLAFVLEVGALMYARRTGRHRVLLLLPPVFLLWANIHIQFVDGLAILGLAWAESAWATLRRTTTDVLKLGPATAVLVASLAATFATPFGWRLYSSAWALASQKGVLDKVQEMQALPFRSTADWAALGLCLGAVAVLARAPSISLFEAGTLAFSILLSFRSQRDVWVTVTVSALILAAHLRPAPQAVVPVRSWMPAAALCLAGTVLFGGFQLARFSNGRLAERVAESLPVQAVAFAQAHHLRGPVFNDYGWGGYLIWALRQPVAIDGRAAFYGDERIAQSVVTWTGRPGWEANPDLRSAQLVIAPADGPLGQLLKLSPSFRLVFADKVAYVFVRSQAGTQPPTLTHSE